MSTDERRLLIMVERLPDEIAQVYGQTKRKKSSQHTNSFKHRKLKNKEDGSKESVGAMTSPAARDTGNHISVSPPHLPMSLPMYSRSVSLQPSQAKEAQATTESLKVKVQVKPRVKVKIRTSKGERVPAASRVLQKIKIRKVSKEVVSSDTAANATDSNNECLIMKESAQEGSTKQPSEKYEIVSSSGKATDASLHCEEIAAASKEVMVAERDIEIKDSVEAWLRDLVSQSSEEMKGEAVSASEESTIKEASSCAGSSVSQDTESYDSSHDIDLESDGSQRTEIEATNCTSSDTEIDESQQDQTKVASSGDVEASAVAAVGASSHGNVLQECSTALEHIVSEVCAENELPQKGDSESGSDCFEDMRLALNTRNFPLVGAGTKDALPKPEETAGQVIVAEILDDESLRGKSNLTDKCDGNEPMPTASPINVIDITDDAAVSDSVVIEEASQCTMGVVPPDSSTDKQDVKTAFAVDVVDLTCDDADCYVVSPVNKEDVAVVSSMTGVCMAAAKELDLFANMTILESWDVEAEAILACVQEYLGHLEKCLTSLDLMEEASRVMLVAALQEKGIVFKKIFGQLKALLCHSEQLNRVFSIESGFCALLGIDNASQSFSNHRTHGKEVKEPNSATIALMRRLSAGVDDGPGRVPPQKSSIAHEVPSIEHKASQGTHYNEQCADLGVHDTGGETCWKPSCDPPANRARTTWRHLVAVASRRGRGHSEGRYIVTAARPVSQENEKRSQVGMSAIQSGRSAVTSAAHTNPRDSIQCDKAALSQLPAGGLQKGQPKPRTSVVSDLQPVTQKQMHHGQPLHKQSTNQPISTLLKELQHIANGSFTVPSTNADMKDKIVTHEIKQVQSPRTAAGTSTSVTTTPLLPASSASLSRQISVLPVVTASSSGKVTALPVSVTVLPVTTASVPAQSVSTTSSPAAGGNISTPWASSAQSSPHSILQKLQLNTSLTVVPVQQREKASKEDTAADIASVHKNAGESTASRVGETAPMCKDGAIAVPSGLSITSALPRAPVGDKIVTKTSEQVAVIQIGKASQQQPHIPTTKPVVSTLSTMPTGRNHPPVSQPPAGAMAVQVVPQRATMPSSTASKALPLPRQQQQQQHQQQQQQLQQQHQQQRQQRPVTYSRHMADARPQQISVYSSAAVSRSVTLMNTSSAAAVPPLRPVTMTTSAHRPLLPRLPAPARPPVSSASGPQPAQPSPTSTLQRRHPLPTHHSPVTTLSRQQQQRAETQAQGEKVMVPSPSAPTSSMAPVLVRATTLQEVQWSQQPNQQLCVTVPGFRVVQASNFQSRVAAPPPLQLCAPALAVGRPVASTVLQPPAVVPPFPWGGFAPQNPRFMGGMPLSRPQPLPGQAMATQQALLPRGPPYYR